MSEKQIWLEGRICPADDFRIDPTDEAVLYGRGLFETTRTWNGRPWLWNRHLERAMRTAEFIGVELKENDLPDVHQVIQFVESLGHEDRVIRLQIAAGHTHATYENLDDRSPSPRALWSPSGYR